jgi:hypothetical protein
VLLRGTDDRVKRLEYRRINAGLQVNSGRDCENRRQGTNVDFAELVE